LSVLSYKNLKTWYLVNKRNLPWRHTNDPYLVWLSEIILQQTKVEQGLSYYEKISKTYPTVNALANAKENDLLLLWQGLGYYSRALNLHKTAKIVKEEYKGVFPDNYLDLLGLPGIGSYTAAAIASFCYLETVPVLDGNVYRVISRIYGIEEPINTGVSKKVFMERLKNLIPSKEPDVFNQAIMEFGALHCTPKQPKCNTCPFVLNCVAYNTLSVNSFPVKKKAKAKKVEYRSYFLLSFKDEIALIKRDKSGIWKNLYELPCIVMDRMQNTLELEEKVSRVFGFVNPAELAKPIFKTTHILSHIKMEVDFYECEVHEKFVYPRLEWVKRLNLESYALHQLMRKFFKEGQ